ncbi:MAG: fibronectin type III domain-containing protein [Thermoanaerobaculia bacterium]
MLDFGTTNDERQVNRFWVDVKSATISYSAPGAGSSTDGGQVSISGTTMKVLLSEDDLALGSRNTTLNAWVVWGPAWQGDSATAAVALGAVGTGLGKDFSTLTTTTQPLTEPLFEQFTFPVVNVAAVWSRLKSAYGLTDNDSDLVSIYQNYLTDLIFFAGGYAAGGNHGDAGVDVNDRTASPFAPTLLHVDRLGRGWNASSNGILSLLLHEFGHRWLYFVRIMEDGAKTSSLNPDGGHPRGGVHLPAAFPVVGTFDVSAMGGAYFTNVEGTGNYTTPAEMATVGLSWNELYLIGLATPSEVAPWFYLTGTGLDTPYNAAAGTTFTPTSRRDVTLQQMIDAIGARTPVYPAAKKAFRNTYVILERASDPVSSPTIASFRTNYINAFATRLAAITGGRASVSYLPNNFAEPVAAPTGINATATGATTVGVTWNAVTGATGYQIFRSASGIGGFAQVGTSVGASYHDTAATNTAYLYRVRATNGGTTSVDSAYDLATTVVFTDSTVTPGTTAIKAVHFTELRTAVNAVRALAGQAAGSYTEPSLGAGTTMKAAHVSEPRSLLDAARAALSLSTLSYTDATLSAATTAAKAAHVTEIRAGTQ